MARGSEVKVVLAGDSAKLDRAFSEVGQSARAMADDVGKQAKRMAGDLDKSSIDIAGGIDASESKFRGLRDTIGGTGDIMEGFRTGNVMQTLMGFQDLAGGITDFIVPALGAMKTALISGLAPALTAISAHPLIAAFLVGGAIVGALVLLEKKFGVVSGTVRVLGETIGAVWDKLKGFGAGAWDWMLDGLKAVGNAVLAALELIANSAISALLGPISLANKIPGVKSFVPDVPRVRLQRLHSGGMVEGVPGSDQLAVLQAGETVLPRGKGAGAATVIHLTVNALDPASAANAVVAALKVYNQRSGAVPVTTIAQR